MDESADSSDRSPGDLILFGLGFLAFLLTAGGIVVSYLPAAVLGIFLLLFVVGCFALRAPTAA